MVTQPQLTVENLESAIDYGRLGKEATDSLESRVDVFRQLASGTQDPYQLTFYQGELGKLNADAQVYKTWQKLSDQMLTGATVDVYGQLLTKYSLPQIKAADAYKGKSLAELSELKDTAGQPDTVAQGVLKQLLKVTKQIGKVRKENMGLAALKAEIDQDNARSSQP